MRGLKADVTWASDPFHPTPVIYHMIAAAVAKLGERLRAAEIENVRRRDSLGKGNGSDARCGRLDPEISAEANRGL
jgi:hypothetical protein